MTDRIARGRRAKALMFYSLLCQVKCSKLHLAPLLGLGKSIIISTCFTVLSRYPLFIMYILLKGDPETEEIGVDKDNISETMYFGDTEDLSDCDKERPGSKAYPFPPCCLQYLLFILRNAYCFFVDTFSFLVFFFVNKETHSELFHFTVSYVSRQCAFTLS